jgi:hypothetical protein
MVEFLLSYDRDDGDGGFVDEFFSKQCRVVKPVAVG